jgi:hypothetical protein
MACGCRFEAPLKGSHVVGNDESPLLRQQFDDIQQICMDAMSVGEEFNS